MTGETNWEQPWLCNAFVQVGFNQGPDYICYFYRPQTKFAKVMFLHLSVSHSVQGGSASVHAGIPPEPGTPPSRHTPPEQAPPGTRYPPCTVHAGRYGQQAVGTASYWNVFLLFLSSKFISISVLSWKNLGI